MQAGRGGGLTEAFSSAESVFGAKTNSFMVRVTTVLASLFLITCLSLAYLSSRKERSLMSESSLMKKELPLKGIPVENSKADALKSQNVKEKTQNAQQQVQPTEDAIPTPGAGVVTNSVQ